MQPTKAPAYCIIAIKVLTFTIEKQKRTKEKNIKLSVLTKINRISTTKKAFQLFCVHC